MRNILGWAGLWLSPFPVGLYSYTRNAVITVGTYYTPSVDIHEQQLCTLPMLEEFFVLSRVCVQCTNARYGPHKYRGEGSVGVES